jgi:hypothetical protein
LLHSFPTRLSSDLPETPVSTRAADAADLLYGRRKDADGQ